MVEVTSPASIFGKAWKAGDLGIAITDEGTLERFVDSDSDRAMALA